MQKGKIFSLGMGESFLNGIITTRNRAVLLSAIFLKTFSHDKQTFLVCWLTSLRLMGVFCIHTISSSQALTHRSEKQKDPSQKLQGDFACFVLCKKDVGFGWLHSLIGRIRIFTCATDSTTRNCLS